MSFSEIAFVAVDQLAPLNVELAFLTFFLLGFILLRAEALHWLFPSQVKAKKVSPPVAEEKAFRGLRKHLAEENSLSFLKAWRAAQAEAPTPRDLLKQVVQALVEVEPSSLVKELTEHIELHQFLATAFTATSALDTVARAGSMDVLMELWEAIPDLGIARTVAMYDIMVGGFASAGRADKVEEFAQSTKAIGGISARGYSLIIKGYLKNCMIDEVLSKILAMQKAGFDVPSFAVMQFFRIACEAGRTEEMFYTAKSKAIQMSEEALTVILEDCVKNGVNLKLAKEVHLIVENDATLYGGVAEALMRIYAAASDHRAFEVLQRMQDMKLPLSENACAGVLVRCANGKFTSFAEALVKHFKSRDKMTISIYSCLMKVYAYAGQYGEACDLYDAIRADGLEPDEIMYGCLMKFAAECGRKSLLDQLSKKVPSLDIQHYMFLIRSAGQQHDVEGAFAVLQQLKESSLEPDIAAFNCVLDVCVKAGDLRRACSLVKDMQKNDMVDIITYNILLKGHCSKGDYKGARQVLHEINAAGLKPNDVSYNSLINTAVDVGNVNEAWEVVSEMEQNGIYPDRYTISIMLKSLKKVQSRKGTARCFELLERSKIEVCSDEVLMNTVLEACIRNKDYQRLEAILQNFEKSNMHPSLPVYSAVIKGYSFLKRLDKCWEHWNELEKRCMQPSQVVTGCMLDALVCNKEIDQAVDFFRQLEKPNTVICAIVLKGFASSNRPEQAMELWREIRSKGMKINLVAYNSLLDAQARAGNTDDVCEVLQTMASEGTCPDSITHSVIVKAYCVKGQLDKAIKAMKGMQQLNLEHDAVVYNTVLDACGSHSRIDLVELILQDMESHRVAPTVFTLGILIKIYARQKQLNRAFEAMETLPKLGNFKTNQQVWIALMCSCLNNNEPDRGMEVYQRIWARHLDVDGRAYEALVSGLVRYGFLRHAIKAVEQAYGLQAGAREDRLELAERSKRLDLGCLEQLFARLSRLGLHKELGVPLLERFRAAKLPVTNSILAMAVSAGLDARRK